MSLTVWIGLVLATAVSAICGTAFVYERDRRKSYAAFDAETARLKTLCDAEVLNRDNWKRSAELQKAELEQLRAENAALAPYRRKRDAHGRFTLTCK